MIAGTTTTEPAQYRFAKPKVCARWRACVAPLLTTAPLIGISLRSDERGTVYRDALDFREDPLSPATLVFSEISTFLALGNFRPIGRFIERAGHVLVFEASNALGVSPHIVNGLARIIMVALLALTVAAMVNRLTTSKPTGRTDWLVGIALAISLVAAGFANGLVVFSILFIGSAVATLWMCMLVVREQDLHAGPTRRRELASAFALGAIAASTYDMTYAVPPLALAFLGAHAFARRLQLADLKAIAAPRRIAALWAGFLAVFLPVRAVIAENCAEQACYAPSAIRLHVDVVPAFVSRLASAGPPSGWAYTEVFIRRDDIDFGPLALLTNPMLLTLGVGIVAVVLVATRRSESAAPSIGQREAIAIAGFGVAVAAAGSLLVSFSSQIQTDGPAPGGGWRESMLTQPGIAMVIGAALFVLVDHARIRNLAPVALSLMLFATLLTNARTTVLDRHQPTSVASNEIGAAVIDFDPVEQPTSQRCSLADRFAALSVDSFPSGPVTVGIIDDLVIAIHGQPFCGALSGAAISADR